MAMKRSLLSEVGTRVRERRKGRGLTMKQLAKAAGLSERFVGELENGRANISVMNLAEVALALEVPVARLLEDPAESGHFVVALLGLRGAGKSTIGKQLAGKLQVPFFELDRLVEAEAGMQLSEIFAIHGEAYFRDAELSALRHFLDSHPRGVLATGGGLVESPQALALLKSRTRTVWLKASPDEHWSRVVEQGDLRPMRDRPQAFAELKRRLKERGPVYAQADQHVVTSGKTVSAVTAEIARRVA
jgi:XRE family aerobic/anaerobic benzoate catabolism transcriptional regulator